MMKRCLAWGVPLVLGGVVVGASGTARGAGEACHRDTDCAGSESCVDGVCGPDPALEACGTSEDCSDGDQVCDDGSCKNEGVVCRNPAGTCWVVDGGGHCECADGLGSGWVDGYNPDDPPTDPTDEEIFTSCTMWLVDSCGTEAPSLPDSCAGAVLEECEAFVEKVDALWELCGEPAPEVNIGRIGECCESFDDPGSSEYRGCVLGLEFESCSFEELEACEGIGGDDEFGDGAAGESQDDAATEKTACGIGGRSSAWALLVLVGLGLGRRRSRPALTRSGEGAR